MTVRRSKEEMETLRFALREIVFEHAPVTCRQTFYLAVSAGLIPKTESAYKTVVVRLLGQMRRSGEIPFSYIADYTRSVRVPQCFTNAAEALEDCARYYRRNIWPGLHTRVEVWTEKETLTGPLYQVTSEYNVPLMPCRGYPSISFLYTAAKAIEDAGVDSVYIYYFGDHDPSGVDIPRVGS